MRRFLQPLLSLVFATAVSCNSESDDSESSERERGSETCRKWHDAICDLAADKCGIMKRGDCDANYNRIFCVDDEIVTQCINQLADANCVSPPIGCDISDIGDQQEGSRWCERYVEAVCRVEVQCGAPTTIEDCTAGSGIDCGDVIGANPEFEECMQELDNMGCSDPVPYICQGVVVAAAGTAVTGQIYTDGDEDACEQNCERQGEPNCERMPENYVESCKMLCVGMRNQIPEQCQDELRAQYQCMLERSEYQCVNGLAQSPSSTGACAYEAASCATCAGEICIPGL